MSTACYLHPAIAASATCEDCRAGLCADCTHVALGRTWCEPCLSIRVGTATIPPPQPPPPSQAWRAAPPPPGGHAIPRARIKRPWLAGLLSVMPPGLGNVYNGFIVRGIAQFAAWWLVFAVARGPWPGDVLSLAAIFGTMALWIWSVLDAVRRARELNERGHGVTPEEARTISLGPVNEEQLRFLGVGLVVIGMLLFAQEIGGFLLDLFRFALPLTLIGVGAWIVRRARLRSEREAFAAREMGA